MTSSLLSWTFSRNRLADGISQNCALVETPLTYGGHAAKLWFHHPPLLVAVKTSLPPSGSLMCNYECLPPRGASGICLTGTQPAKWQKNVSRISVSTIIDIKLEKWA